MADTEVFKAALQALFGTDSAAQQQANQWLHTFSTSPQAWQAAFNCLEPTAADAISFFCANLLVTKLRNEWHKLDAQHRDLVLNELSGKMAVFVQQKPYNLATSRICMAVATAAASSGADKARALAQHALELAQGAAADMASLGPALALLGCLAEEVEQQERARRSAAVAALEPSRTQVMALMQSLLLAAVGGAAPDTLVRPSLQCLGHWLRLGGEESSGYALSPRQLLEQAPHLLQALLQLISGGDHENIEAAAEILSTLLGGTRATSMEAERAALQVAGERLVQLMPQVQAAGDDGAAVAAAVARVVAAMSERDVEWATAATPLAEALARLMLACAGRPEHLLAELATDYFLQVNTMPLADRHPFLQREVYVLLAPCLLAHSQYPPDFTTWEEQYEVDQEAFNRFRDHCLHDLAETTYAMAGLQLLGLLRGTLAGCASWQACEGALYLMRCVSVALKSRAVGREGHGGHAEQQDSAAFIQSVFQALCGPPGQGLEPWLVASPWVVQTAAGLVGDFGPWFCKRPQQELRDALLLLFRALGVPQASNMAGKAFRSVCSRCGTELGSDPALLRDLIAAACAQVAPLPAEGSAAGHVALGQEEREWVVEGLARAVAVLPVDAAAEAGQMLVRPLVQRAQSIISHGNMSGGSGQALLQVLAADLRLMSTAVRYMEFPRAIAAGPAHPAIRVLEGCWPVVAAVAQSPLCQQQQEVVAALCDVYQRTLLSTKAAAKPLLPDFINSLVAIFCAQLQPCCLEPLATVVEVFGEVRSAPEVAALQARALHEVCGAASAALQRAGGNLASHGEMLAALLRAADRHVIFAVDTVLDSPVLATLMHMAVEAAVLRERAPVAEGLAFLQHLLTAWERVRGQQPGGRDAAGAHQQATEEAAEATRREARLVQAQACLAARGPRLLEALLLALLDTAPRQQLRTVSGCLHNMLCSDMYRDAAVQWMTPVLQRQNLPGMQAGLLRGEDCAMFLRCAVRQPAMVRGRFDAMAADFANIARGEGTADALLAYEM